jgi:hypothetical protein
VGRDNRLLTHLGALVRHESIKVIPVRAPQQVRVDTSTTAHAVERITSALNDGRRLPTEKRPPLAVDADVRGALSRVQKKPKMLPKDKHKQQQQDLAKARMDTFTAKRKKEKEKEQTAAAARGDRADATWEVNEQRGVSTSSKRGATAPAQASRRTRRNR